MATSLYYPMLKRQDCASLDVCAELLGVHRSVLDRYVEKATSDGVACVVCERVALGDTTQRIRPVLTRDARGTIAVWAGYLDELSEDQEDCKRFLQSLVAQMGGTHLCAIGEWKPHRWGQAPH
jgi:hypothetical protein